MEQLNNTSMKLQRIQTPNGKVHFIELPAGIDYSRELDPEAAPKITAHTLAIYLNHLLKNQPCLQMKKLAVPPP